MNIRKPLYYISSIAFFVVSYWVADHPKSLEFIFGSGEGPELGLNAFFFVSIPLFVLALLFLVLALAEKWR